MVTMVRSSLNAICDHGACRSARPDDRLLAALEALGAERQRDLALRQGRGELGLVHKRRLVGEVAAPGAHVLKLHATAQPAIVEVAQSHLVATRQRLRDVEGIRQLLLAALEAVGKYK